MHPSEDDAEAPARPDATCAMPTPQAKEASEPMEPVPAAEQPEGSEQTDVMGDDEVGSASPAAGPLVEESEKSESAAAATVSASQTDCAAKTEVGREDAMPRDLWPSEALGSKWHEGHGAETNPCAGLQRGQLPSLLPTHDVRDPDSSVAARMGRMSRPNNALLGVNATGAVSDDELDARLLQQRSLTFEPVCELCGKSGSLPLQGPLVGPFAERPLELPLENTAREQALVRAPGWAHTWCMHYAVAEQPPGTLTGDVPAGPGLEHDTIRAVNAIRKGRRATCGVCWQPGATVACGFPGCARQFHLSCARWQPSLRPETTSGPLSLGSVRCSRHMQDAQHFTRWRQSLEEFVLTQYPPTFPPESKPAVTRSTTNNLDAPLDGSQSISNEAAGADVSPPAAATVAALDEHHGKSDASATAADDKHNDNNADDAGSDDEVAGADSVSPPVVATTEEASQRKVLHQAATFTGRMTARPSEAELRCEAAANATSTSADIGDEKVAGARASKDLLQHARSLVSYAPAADNTAAAQHYSTARSEEGDEVALQLTPLVRGAINIVRSDQLLLQAPAPDYNHKEESHDDRKYTEITLEKKNPANNDLEKKPEAAACGLQHEASIVANGAKKLVQVASFCGAWQETGTVAARVGSQTEEEERQQEEQQQLSDSIGTTIQQFAAVAREVVGISEQKMQEVG